MPRLAFQDPAWYQATTLTERARSLRESGGRADYSAAATRVAELLFHEWQSQAPFTNAAYFEQRLALDNLDQHEFLYLLGEPTADLRGRLAARPAWLAALERAYGRYKAADAAPLPFPEDIRDHEAASFLNLVAPLIHDGLDRVRAGIRQLTQTGAGLPFDPQTIDALLLADLPKWLLMMISRTLVLELHVARLEGRLAGDIPQERFQSFVQHLHRPDAALAILQEYPVLARRLVVYLDNWVDSSLEFLGRLCADWDAIRATFSPDADPGTVVHLQIGAGDRHRRGRSVVIAQFSSGFQVVYKPKSLAVERHFQELLGWLNQRGSHPPFRQLATLDRGSHGWIEFVAAHACTTTAQVRRFYERQGAFLALLYVLEATDFHFENLIAAGEHPVPIDLESLFQARIDSISAAQQESWVAELVNNSVLRTGLLPQRRWVSEEFAGIDVSGLSDAAGQLNPHPIPVWEASGTDEMHIARQRVGLQGGHNRPTLDGATLNTLDYAEDIIAGFRTMYRLLLERRDELLAPDGPLARFAEDEVRVILRPTRTYGLLLQEGFHPDGLRDAFEQERLLDRLWVAVEQQPYLAKVIPYERGDLWDGDIPIFTTRPAAHDLWSSSGRRIDGFFATSGLASVEQRLRQLGDDDLERQVWFIRAALTALTIDLDSTPNPVYRARESYTRPARERLLAPARAIGDRLGQLALCSQDGVAWIGLTVVDEVFWSPLPLDLDFYNGISGVAHFLAYLGHLTGETRYTGLARAAMRTVLRQVEERPAAFTCIGGFIGWGGLIYTLTHLGALWREPALLARAEKLVELAGGMIAEDRELDVVGGAAGLIGTLLSLHRCRPAERTLATAIACGDHLIAHAKPMAQGATWSRRGGTEPPLAGFSHGTAGIAWALLELSARTGAARFREMARQAIVYERSLFSPEHGNWPDLRELDFPGWKRDAPRFMSAWCHGASGIALARLRALAHLDDPQLHPEIEIALRTTLTRGFGGNHSLCHGELGNLEPLLQACQILGDPLWRAHVDRIAAILLDSIDEHGWLCGVPHGVETPGLMTGLAGIGYGLLRLAEPERVPSLLILEPPSTMI